MRRRAVKRLRRFHECLRERRMRMDRVGDVACGGAHLDRQYAFADQLAGARADDTDTEDPFGLGFDDQFGQAIGAVERQRSARGAPQELGDFDVDAFLLGFGFGETAPGHLGIGVHDRRDDDIFKSAGFAEHRFDGDLAFSGRAVGQQRAAVDVADGVDVGIFGLLLGVAVNEPFIVLGDLGVFQTEVGEIGRAADADQHAIVKFIARLFVDFDGDFDLFAGGGHLQDFGVEANFFEGLLRRAHHRAGEIGIDAGKNRRQAPPAPRRCCRGQHRPCRAPCRYSRRRPRKLKARSNLPSPIKQREVFISLIKSLCCKVRAGRLLRGCSNDLLS